MTATRTLYRTATVSPAEATASLFKKFPTMDLVSFVKKEASADEAAAAKTNEGDLVYAATICVAEFSPAEEEETPSGGDAGGEDAGAPAPKEKDPDDDGDDDSSESGDTDNDFAGKDKGDEHKGVEPKKLSPDEQIIHLLQQILDSLNGGGKDPLDGPDGPGGLPGGPLDLPDVGAPGKGEGLGGPPMGGKAPLPPPIKEKSPIGAGAFSHIAGYSEVQMVREDAGTVSNKQILKEAAQYAPTHYVEKIKRTGLAKVGNDLIDLAEAKLALVTLVSK